MKKKLRFTVYINQPSDITIQQIKQYITDSIKSSRGDFRPSDPMYHLNVNSIAIKRKKD